MLVYSNHEKAATNGYGSMAGMRRDSCTYYTGEARLAISSWSRKPGNRRSPGERHNCDCPSPKATNPDLMHGDTTMLVHSQSIPRSHISPASHLGRTAYLAVSLCFDCIRLEPLSSSVTRRPVQSKGQSRPHASDCRSRRGASEVATTERSQNEKLSRPSRPVRSTADRTIPGDLEGRGRKVLRYKIIPVGSTTLFSDLADITDNILYEAKGSADRMAVRLALGQVLDYGRYITGSRLAVLLPEAPAADLVELLELHDIGCVVETTPGTFADMTSLNRCP